MENKFKKIVSVGTSLLLTGATYAWKPAVITGGAMLVKACGGDDNNYPESDVYYNWVEAGIDIDFHQGEGVSDAQMDAAIAA